MCVIFFNLSTFLDVMSELLELFDTLLTVLVGTVKGHTETDRLCQESMRAEQAK